MISIKNKIAAAVVGAGLVAGSFTLVAPSSAQAATVASTSTSTSVTSALSLSSIESQLEATLSALGLTTTGSSLLSTELASALSGLIDQAQLDSFITAIEGPFSTLISALDTARVSTLSSIQTKVTNALNSLITQAAAFFQPLGIPSSTWVAALQGWVAQAVALATTPYLSQLTARITTTIDTWDNLFGVTTGWNPTSLISNLLPTLSAGLTKIIGLF